jgi:hypothetical protein
LSLARWKVVFILQLIQVLLQLASEKQLCTWEVSMWFFAIILKQTKEKPEYLV